MALMLRPDLWTAMYDRSPGGAQLHSGDPSMMPRWLYMMLGSIGVTGFALAVLGMKEGLEDAVSGLFTRRGGRLVAGFTLIQPLIGIWVFRTQSEAARGAVSCAGGDGVDGAGPRNAP